MRAKELGGTAFAMYEARKAAVAAAHPERPVTGIMVEPNLVEGHPPNYICGACDKPLTFDAGAWGHP